MLSIILDVVVLCGLGATIYYCIRLSKSLNAFRQHREEFSGLMMELGNNIEKAQVAVDNLKNASFEAGEDLQKVIHHGKALKEELELMNEAGDSMASRLEKAAEKNRKAAQRTVDKSFPEPSSAKFDEKLEEKSEKKSSIEPFDAHLKTESPIEKPLFSIQDRDFEADMKAGAEEDLDQNFSDFQSQAERELFEAIQKGKRH